MNEYEQATYEECLDQAAPEFGADGVADWIGSAVEKRWPGEGQPEDIEDDAGWKRYDHRYTLVCIDVLERALAGYKARVADEQAQGVEA
jgi:hypothetical protein